MRTKIRTEAVWLVILGFIICAFGQWWGACFFVLAGLVGWLAYKLPRSRARALNPTPQRARGLAPRGRRRGFTGGRTLVKPG